MLLRQLLTAAIVRATAVAAAAVQQFIAVVCVAACEMANMSARLF